MAPEKSQNATDVAVIGGGVMGCATAYYLASSGVRVTLVELNRVGGTPSASGASAAILEALAGHPAALAQQGQLSRRLIAGLASELRDLTGIDIEFQRLGSVHLAFSEREAAAYKDQVPALFAALDEPVEWLDGATVRHLSPAVSERAHGGLHVPSTSGVYAPRYVRALAAGAAARGAIVREGVAVTGLETSGDRVCAVRTTEGRLIAGQVVIAAGAWTGIISRWLSRPLPIAPQRGQIMALSPAPGQARIAQVVHGPGGYLIPKANGTVCAGATHEMVGFDARVTAAGMKFLADLALRLAPGLETASLKHSWLGFRPVLLVDVLPAVGRLPGLENAYVAAGHGAIGMTVSAGVGYLLAQLIQGQAPEQSLDAFDPARVVANR